MSCWQARHHANRNLKVRPSGNNQNTDWSQGHTNRAGRHSIPQPDRRQGHEQPTSPLPRCKSSGVPRRYTTNAGTNKPIRNSGNKRPHPRRTNKNIVTTLINKPGANIEKTGNKTNTNIHKAKWTKLVHNILPKAKPPDWKEPATKRSLPRILQ